MYRNIFEEQLPSEESLNFSGGIEEKEREKELGYGWTDEQTATIPLESDADAIEYLARHDFNFERAAYSLYCEMGCGKGEWQLWKFELILPV